MSKDKFEKFDDNESGYKSEEESKPQNVIEDNVELLASRETQTQDLDEKGRVEAEVKPSIKTLQQYIAGHSEDRVLANVAAVVFLSIPEPTSNTIFVIDGPVDLLSLDKGYYLRFLRMGNDRFHLYGVEVHSKGDITIHENIPREQFKQGYDNLFNEQLVSLNEQNRVYFRVATTRGGGLDLHKDLAVQYAKTGLVGAYVNSAFDRSNNLTTPAINHTTKVTTIEEQLAQYASTKNIIFAYLKFVFSLGQFSLGVQKLSLVAALKSDLKNKEDKKAVIEEYKEKNKDLVRKEYNSSRFFGKTYIDSDNRTNEGKLGEILENASKKP